jgi:hypothetical protein
MPEENVSLDEYLSKNKAFTKESDHGTIVLKGRNGSPSSWNKDERTVRFIMTAEVEDRDRDVIKTGGLDIQEFLKNPIAPFGHRSREMPVGHWKDIEKVLTGRPKRMEGTLQLVKEGGDEVADRLAFHLGEGTIKACTIGFIPKAIKRREIPEEKKDDAYFWPGYEIDEAELMECSPVTIPANPAALAKAAAGGDRLAKETIEWVLETFATDPAFAACVDKDAFLEAHTKATGERTVVVVPPQAPQPEAQPSSTAPSLFRRALNIIVGKDTVDALDEMTLDPSQEAEKVVEALKAMKERKELQLALEAKREALKARTAKNLAA